MDHILSTFIAEARELLDSMEADLLAMESEPPSKEIVGAVFRAAHTIKGSAGMFGFEAVVSFTHVVETLLDRVRSGEQSPSRPIVSLLLDCQDQMRSLIEAVAAGGDGMEASLAARSSVLVERLKSAMGEGTTALVTPSGTASVVLQGGSPASTAIADDQVASTTQSATWHISVRYRPDVLQRGCDPLVIARYLGSIGEVKAVRIVDDALPPAREFNPTACYLGFEISLDSAADKEQIEAAFEFVRDDCTLTILPPRSRISDYVRLIHDLPEGNVKLGEMLVQCGSLTREELQRALRHQAETAASGTAPVPALGEVLIQQKVVQAPVVEAALEKQNRAKKAESEKRSLRVDASKLDHLIDSIGELIIAGAATQQLATRARMTELNEAASLMSRLVEQVRDQAMNLRMVEIGPSFTRFQRVVRDLSNELGKDIKLRISGADTELDKILVEQISDPLTHLVRNAVGHGIEPSSVRIAKGKDPQGTVHLNAYHDSGSVVIEVSDDGGGLSKERIIAKALSKGLITEGQELTDREVYDLIFEPGFSTAEKVTSLSGRGVGMDVVRRNITDLRGTIEFDSIEGQGTTMRIRLPLTLAIIDGFLVYVGRSALVIPLDVVEECVEWEPSEEDLKSGNHYMDLRGTALPFIRLREMFCIEDSPPARESLVVVRCGERRAGLMVDKLQGEMQTVIKPLAPMFSHLRGISGSTILGDGSIALIVDVPTLIEQMRHQASMPPRPRKERAPVESALAAPVDAGQPGPAF